MMMFGRSKKADLSPLGEVGVALLVIAVVVLALVIAIKAGLFANVAAKEFTACNNPTFKCACFFDPDRPPTQNPGVSSEAGRCPVGDYRGAGDAQLSDNCPSDFLLCYTGTPEDQQAFDDNLAAAKKQGVKGRCCPLNPMHPVPAHRLVGYDVTTSTAATTVGTAVASKAAAATPSYPPAVVSVDPPGWFNDITFRYRRDTSSWQYDDDGTWTDVSGGLSGLDVRQLAVAMSLRGKDELQGYEYLRGLIPQGLEVTGLPT